MAAGLNQAIFSSQKFDGKIMIGVPVVISHGGGNNTGEAGL